MKVSVLMTTFNRDHLLRWGLQSIKQQNFDCEVTVINDGLPNNTEMVAKEYGARYLYTGSRNEKQEYWRVPGFALNIGAKQVDSEIIILTCAEMWHIGDCLKSLVKPLLNDPMALCIPQGKDDQQSEYLDNLLKTGEHSQEIYDRMISLKTELPFLMAMKREHFMSIGGYDEDFAGQSYDDDDLVGRLQSYGCHYIKTDARCVHLFHSRRFTSKSEAWRLQHNRDLYNRRKGVIVRNKDHEWGVLQ